MQTLIINPTRRKGKMPAKRKTNPRRRRRSSVTMSKANLLRSIILGFLGFSAAVAGAKVVKFEKKWLVGLIGSLATASVGTKVLSAKTALPLAVGMGIAGASNFASQSNILGGVFSDYMPCSYSQYPMLSPRYGHQYLDAGSEADDLYEYGELRDYWENPARAGATYRDLDFAP